MLWYCGTIYPLKNVNYAETQNYVRLRCPRTLEHYKERIRTEESIQRFGCIRRHGWYQEIHPRLDSEGKDKKEIISKTLRKFEVLRNVLENFIENAMRKIDMIWAMFKVYFNNPNYLVKQSDYTC